MRLPFQKMRNEMRREREMGGEWVRTVGQVGHRELGVDGTQSKMEDSGAF